MYHIIKDTLTILDEFSHMKIDMKPEEQERMLIRSEQACDNLFEEQHLVSFGSKDPETNLSQSKS